jgi:hypothetical protein
VPSNGLAADGLPAPLGTTERVSVADDERQGDAASGGVTALIDSANSDQAISGDGRWVAFVSSATNLAPGGDRPGLLYLRNRQDGTTTLIPWIGGGQFPPGVTAAEPSMDQDGGVVAFTAIVTGKLRGVTSVEGSATPYVLLWDRVTGTELISLDASGQAVPGFQPSVSADGSHVAYTQWGPEATPPPTPTPPPNNAPANAGRASSRGCIDTVNTSSIVSVTATDPDGDSLALRIQLSWTDGFGNTLFRFPAAMTYAGGTTWTYDIRSSDIASYGWSGQINYAATARDARGADSGTLRDNPFLDPPSNSVMYTSSSCTIL